MEMAVISDKNETELFYVTGLEGYNTVNSTSIGDNEELSLLSIIASFERIFVPCISFPGLVGNFLSAVTFLSDSLRRSKCSLFLAARCINDIVFLLCLLFIWVSVTFDLNLIHVFGACHSVIFLTFFTSFMAVWLCGCITFENYLLITNKLMTRRWYTTKTPTMCLVTLSFVGVCAYIASFWMADERCYLNQGNANLTQTLAYVDIFLTFIFPAGVIIALLILISVKLSQIKYEKRRRMSSLSMYSLNSTATSVASPAVKVTQMLLIYIILLFILHCPSHAMTLFYLIKMAREDTIIITPNQAALRSCLQMLFYLGFTLNFVVFYSFSLNFRNAFLRTFCCRRIRSTIRTDALPMQMQRRHTIQGVLQVEDDPELYKELEACLRKHRCASQ